MVFPLNQTNLAVQVWAQYPTCCNLPDILTRYEQKR
jgi:hypothetical protein